MNNQLIMRSLPMVASVLGKKYGVKVEVGGTEAYTDGQTIHLPSLPFDSGDEFVNLVRAFLDHESAHIRHSDFDMLKGTAISPLTMNIFNMLEDWRVENQLVKSFPGCRANFDFLIKHHFVHQLPIQGKESVLLIADYILLSIRSWDVAEVKPNRDLIRKVLEAEFGDLLLKLDATLENARITCDGTATCLDYAVLIVALLEKESKGNPPQSPNDSNSNKGESKGQKSGSERGDGDVTEDESDPQGDCTAATNTDASATNSIPIQNAQICKQLKKLLGATEGKLPQDMSKHIGEQLESATPVTGKGVKVAIESEKPHRALSHNKRNDARSSTIALRSRLQGLLQTTTLKRRTSGRRGRLDTSKLYKAGHDSKIFLKNADRQGIDTAVHILLDCSGSMRNRMDLASQACFAVCDSLSHISGVSVGATAFPANNAKRDKGGSISETVGTILKHDQLIHSEFSMNASGNTPMGEALWWVMQQLQERSENRKLILIITDGEASNRINAKTAIEQGLAMGYELYGLGICDKHIQDLLPDTSRVINDINELAAAMFNLLQGALLQVKP